MMTQSLATFASSDQLRRPETPAMLLALGTATPAFRASQEDIAKRMARLWQLKGVELARWRRIIEGSEIEFRQGVLPPEEVVFLSTARRMELYEHHAPTLAAQAAREALADCGLSPDDITDLILVSCTGFVAPGIDIALIEMLGFRADVRRCLIGFMGCFGAIGGLRAAVGACASNPEATVLVIAVELCSLHMRAEASTQNQVAAALFSDGAAAAVLRGGSDQSDLRSVPTPPQRGYVNTGRTLALPEGKNWMSWRITDTGFAMTLTREVPNALKTRLAAFVADASQSTPPPRSFAIHPGGPGILDAVEDALKIQGRQGLEVSRRILREHGNMSSPTVLFVLRELLRAKHQLPTMLLAFGPGLTIDSISVLPFCEID